MKIVAAFPPNIAAIHTAFGVANSPGIIFTYGDTVYCPSGRTLSPELQAHEQVHVDRQLAMGPEKWWDEYIINPEFRLAEELPAHQAEYKLFCDRHGERKQRNDYLYFVAGRLSGPLYAGLIGPAKAASMIKKGLKR